MIINVSATKRLIKKLNPRITRVSHSYIEGLNRKIYLMVYEHCNTHHHKTLKKDILLGIEPRR